MKNPMGEIIRKLDIDKERNGEKKIGQEKNRPEYGGERKGRDCVPGLILGTLSAAGLLAPGRHLWLPDLAPGA